MYICIGNIHLHHYAIQRNNLSTADWPHSLPDIWMTNHLGKTFWWHM